MSDERLRKVELYARRGEDELGSGRTGEKKGSILGLQNGQNACKGTPRPRKGHFRRANSRNPLKTL